MEDEASGAGDAEATSLLRGMSSRASRVEAEITRRLRSEFGSLVKPRQTIGVAGAGGAREGDGNMEAGGEAGRRESKRRALLSCLRPFSALGSGIEAEKQFSRYFCCERCASNIRDGRWIAKYWRIACLGNCV